MNGEKMDYKKIDKELYQPGEEPSWIYVPTFHFVAVEGQGDPSGEAYQRALQVLYSVSFTVKMSKMNGKAPAGYFEYVVPPLEGLWWSDWEGHPLHEVPRKEWRWVSMIRQPEFVTEETILEALEVCRRKKKEMDFSGIRFCRWEEGVSVQCMHKGSYADEPRTLEKMRRWIRENGWKDCSGRERKHHEIYLSDPRRTAPDRLRTVLRIPVEKQL